MAVPEKQRSGLETGSRDHDRVTPSAFAEAMARIVPPASQRVAVAVSGGSDSLALALLTARWQRSRGGSVLALVVDHGLRPESAFEAQVTLDRLKTQKIEARLIRLTTLHRGSAIASRARAARYDALIAACRNEGILDLLLGHHRQDQAETIWIRQQAASAVTGLAGMAVVREASDIRLLRPLLAFDKTCLRNVVRDHGLGWVEDPSNHAPAAGRTQAREVVERDGQQRDDLLAVAHHAAMARRVQEQAIAQELAATVSFLPEGYALVSGNTLSCPSLAAVLAAVSGRDYRPRHARLTPFQNGLRSMTLEGVRVMPAGRLPGDWLIVREHAAQQPPISARDGGLWDQRFRIRDPSGEAEAKGLSLGALGKDAKLFRSRDGLPSVILQTLPSWRQGENLIAVPHLGIVRSDPGATLCLSPAQPATGALFQPAVMG
ncbi:tRNA(Ile)-lysidine synthetase TilS [Granulibacter bethesdensis]|uniref:tRNA(Ile)-lysidine synthase n=1 Tax=Granulibacter bethesdensis TaxID=364410 RepID=A0AAC9KE32_9PROT|nr:tRNA lysidine(34) synthetase TilS [Granulibacter bethesdensis]APH54390.1 tRNA(Ile)-lysidine synthetase TilS [Granulibacter bethesdensis]APH61975.1 tRNA(Ile)-lysidine synthetase TilS [Granulibacter bethesdensis]